VSTPGALEDLEVDPDSCGSRSVGHRIYENHLPLWERSSEGAYPARACVVVARYGPA